MKTNLLLLLIAFTVRLNAQVTVKGIVTVQNSGNQPIPGVQIKALGTTPEVTGNDGLFRLVFTGKKPGDRIIVSEIAKKGFEIVNKEVVNNWVITTKPEQRTKIVMCPEGLIAANTLKYYNISFDGLARGYNEQIRKYQEERDKALMNAQAYGEKMKLLAEQFENQQKYLEELAEKFARENFDDCSEVQRQAFDAFRRGDIGEAIRILETVNSAEEIQKAKKQHQEAVQRKAEIEGVISQTDSVIRQNIRKLLFQADLYVSDFRFEDALKAYEAAVYADTTDFENIFCFVIFLFDQRQYSSATKWCRTALANAETKYERAQALRYMANTQAQMMDYEGAEHHSLEAVDLLTELADESPMEYGYILLLALNDFGIMQIGSQHYDRAKQILNKALTVSEKYNYTPEGEPPARPLIYGNLGHTYLALNQPDSAEFWMNNAIKDFSQADGSGSILNNYPLAFMLNNLSQIYDLRREFDKSASILLQALAINRELAGKNPQRFNPDLVVVLNNLSIAYLAAEDYKNADLYAAEAEIILKDLIKTYPVIYHGEMASILTTRGVVQSRLKNNEKAEFLQIEALNYLRQLASVNPLVHRDWLALSLSNLANTQSELGKFELALQNSIEAVDILLELEASYPGVYSPKLGLCMTVLARLYYAMHKFEKSEECYIRSLKIYYEMDTEMQQINKQELFDVQKELLTLYRTMNKVDKGNEHVTEAIQFYKGLAQGKPEVYLSYMAYYLSELSWIQYKSDVLQAISTMNLAMEAYHLCRDSGFTYPISSLAICYGRMARYQILNKRFDEAEKYALMSLETEPLEMNYKNLAHSLLYNGKYREAEEIYIRMKDKKCDCNPPEPYKKWFLRDLDEFEKAGIKHPDVKKIRKKLADKQINKLAN